MVQIKDKKTVWSGHVFVSHTMATHQAITHNYTDDISLNSHG